MDGPESGPVLSGPNERTVARFDAGPIFQSDVFWLLFYNDTGFLSHKDGIQPGRLLFVRRFRFTSTVAILTNRRDNSLIRQRARAIAPERARRGQLADAVNIYAKRLNGELTARSRNVPLAPIGRHFQIINWKIVAGESVSFRPRGTEGRVDCENSTTLSNGTCVCINANSHRAPR